MIEGDPRATEKVAGEKTNMMAGSRSGPLLRYGVAGAGVLLATLATMGAAPVTEHAIFLFYWPALIGIAWYAGAIPALLASIATVFITDYFFIPPLHSIGPITATEFWPLIAFFLVS